MQPLHVTCMIHETENMLVVTMFMFIMFMLMFIHVQVQVHPFMFMFIYSMFTFMTYIHAYVALDQHTRNISKQ